MTLPVVKQNQRLYLALSTHSYSASADNLSEFWLCARIESREEDGVFRSRIFRSSERLFVKKLSNLATPRMTTVFAARDVKAHEIRTQIVPVERVDSSDDPDDLQARLDWLRR